MNRLLIRFIAFIVGAAACDSVAFAQAPKPREFRPGAATRTSDLPESGLRRRLEELPAPARERALEHLRNFHFTEQDLISLNADEEGTVFYADHFQVDPVIALAEDEPVVAQAARPIDPFPETLVFHSRPGASNIIYLNFSGESITGSAWNLSLGRTTISAMPFSADADYSTFSDAEQTAIKRIWQRVAEDYAPFDVDVTTERPPSFNTRTAHALITRDTDSAGAATPSAGAGGVAYIGTFATSTYAKYRPAWIYVNNLSGVESYIAEAVSHEVGHNLGLSHDGTTSGSSYYGGHGSGGTSWGPIMGTGYGRNVSQWSKGEYHLANNTQDDLATIASRIAYRVDDHGGSAQTATALTIVGSNIVATTPETDPFNTMPANKGVIERAADMDVFSLTTGSGIINLKVNPWIQPEGMRGGNLDLSVELRDAAGALVLATNPVNDTAAQIQVSVSAGTYYLHIRNTGVGSPLSSPPSGYTSYGSLGQYFISGAIAPVPAAPIVTTNHPTPLWWLAAHGVNEDFETAVDRAGANGLPLWKSYVAGLDPTSATSQLRLSVTGNVLSWNPVAGRTYTLWWSTNAFDAFTVLQGASNLPPSIATFTNAAAISLPQTFYRIEARLP